MESHSAPTGRGHVPWQGLLLAVSLLIFWSPPTTAQVTVLSASASEGKDVVLPVLNEPRDVAVFVWFRGIGENVSCIIAVYMLPAKLHQTGPAHSGREKVLSNGFLLIENVTMEDRGNYTVVAHSKDGTKEMGSGWLHVYQLMREPTLQADRTTVTENKDAVILTCYTNEISVQWLFNGGSLQLTERMKLSKDHRTLTIDPVKREDAGIYECKVFNPYSFLKSVPVKLNVEY